MKWYLKDEEHRGEWERAREVEGEGSEGQEREVDHESSLLERHKLTRHKTSTAVSGPPCPCWRAGLCSELGMPSHPSQLREEPHGEAANSESHGYAVWRRSVI